MARIRIIILLFLGFVRACGDAILSAQSPGIAFDFYSVEHGLPHKQVNDITQDDLGYMWIATTNGLARYDGYAFEDMSRLLTGMPELKGLHVDAVEKDDQGRIWIGHVRGLAVLDPRSMAVRPVPLAVGTGAEPSVNRIVFDRDGRMLLFVDNARLLCFDRSMRPVFSFSTPVRQTMSDGSYPLILEDADGTYWLPTYFNGIDHISRDGRPIAHYAPDRTGSEDSPEKRMDLPGGVKHAFSLGPREEMPRAMDKDEGVAARIWHYRRYLCPSGLSDRRGNQWTIRPGSLVVDDPVTKSSFRLDLPYDEEYFGDYAPRSLYVSADNTLWAASRKGLFKVSYRRSPFVKYLHEPNLPPGKLGISIRGMAEDSAGRIWIGSYPYAVEGTAARTNLSVLDPKTRQVTPFIPRMANGEDFSGESKPAYKLVIRGRHLWSSSEANYISRLDMNTGLQDTFAFSQPGLLPINGLWVYPDGSVRIATVSAAAAFYPPSPGRPSRLHRILEHPAGGQAFGANNFFDAGDDRLWVASNAGLFLVDRGGRILRMYNSDPAANGSLPALDINMVYPQAPDALWLGTRHGLVRLDTLRGTARLYTTQDGLPNNNVMAIIPDEFGYLWMSTDRGLCRFHPGEHVFIQYDDPEALSNLEFNRMAFLRASDGRLFFGGLNGVTAFYPRDMDTSLIDLRPLLVSYAVIRQDRDTLIPATDMVQPGQPLFLGHADKFFRFRFMLPAYRQPGKNKFIYRLEGWEEDWQTTVGTNTISYNYLPPGRYLLRVRGAPAGELWTRPEYTLPIVIRQAWYRTAWFVAGFVLVMAGIFFAAYRYRLRQLLRIQQVRNQISADLHDELGSVLTQIALQSDMVSRDIYSPEEKRTELENIRNTSREAIHAMSDIVWSVSAGHDKASSLIDRMKDHADLMLSPLGIEPEFRIFGLPDDRTIDGLVRQELFLIFKEAIHNIVKHARPFRVRIDMGNRGGLFSLRIENDLHLPPDMKAVLGGHGLENMKRRAARIDATLEVSRTAERFIVHLQRREI